MYLPEGFLAADVIVTLVANIADGMHVWPQVVRARVMSELPFMATENILMACVQVRRNVARARARRTYRVASASVSRPRPSSCRGPRVARVAPVAGSRRAPAFVLHGGSRGRVLGWGLPRATQPLPAFSMRAQRVGVVQCRQYPRPGPIDTPGLYPGPWCHPIGRSVASLGA